MDLLLDPAFPRHLEGTPIFDKEGGSTERRDKDIHRSVIGKAKQGEQYGLSQSSNRSCMA